MNFFKTRGPGFLIFEVCTICCVLFFSLFFFYQKVWPYTVVLKAEKTPVWSQLVATEEDVEKAKQILQRPLKLLGYGTQCFAFASEGEEYVVKICRASRYRIFSPFRAKKRKENDFQSYSLACHALPQQSQVVFIHLNKTDNLHTTLDFVDPWGFAYSLKADDLAFYIQKKAILLEDYLRDLPASESRVLARRLLDLFKSCCEEGLQFRDIYPKNIGVHNGFPLWIDPGRITPKASLKEERAQRKGLSRFKALLTPFLMPINPEFSAMLDEEFEACF